MKISPRNSVSWLTFACITLFAAVAEAASLSRPEVVIQTSPTPLQVANCEPAGLLPICVLATSSGNPNILPISRVEAEDGEQDGDDAPLCATWEGSVTTSASTDPEPSAFASAAAGGGVPIAAPPPPPGDDPPIASTDNAYLIIRRGGIDLDTVTFDSLVNTGPPGSTESETISMPLETKIGDEIAFGVSVAAAVSAQAGGSASASARSAISLRFGPCDDDSGGSPPGPPAPVPTLSEWSLIVLVMLLAAIGYRRVRKQQG